MANTQVGFLIKGHVEEADHPCIGFCYADGPADFVVVDTFWHSKVEKGVCPAVDYRGYPACTDMLMSSPAFWLVFPTDGLYTLDVFAGYLSDETRVVEDGPYPVSIQVSPFTPPSVSITGFDVPTKAYVGIAVDCSVSGHVDVGGGNPFVGLMYVDGPSSNVTIGNEAVGKGAAKVYGYVTFKDACTSLAFNSSIVYPLKGTYKIGVLAGYIDIVGNVLVPTVRTDVSVDVEVPLANISGKVVESYLFGLIKRASTGAKVSLDSLKSVYSQAGMYSLTDVPLGTYTVTASKNFFEEKGKLVTLGEVGKTYTLDFQISVSKLVNYGVVAGAVAVPLLVAVSRLPTPKPAIW
jgi:hypothetical protein